MIAFRRVLSWIAAGCLCCQLSILTAAPASLLTHAAQAADAIACTCVHTGNATCPMHRPRKHDGCECRSTTDPDAASVVSLLGPIAVLASAPSQLAPPSFQQLPTYPITRFTDAIAPVASPPPRA